ncbi:hypothetical protein XBJ2_2580048 [Xenorhabdus bovienii str. Jollieti]|uniref:Uncharacterized protein n=1 Tax=Xenorhabdus bovienii (strain SS-2004) TaxID=406818 RepID=D3UXH3_XENBS|nr:hypothetical protein XBJ1_1215 [Xenorhabdus bovienii SS-2004]CDH29401.1 hypothetical protein XBJ2_2580048 [Xenorhabdus bovienii str. Jollieti]
MNYMFSVFSHFHYSGIDVNDSELLFVNDEFSPADVWHWA